VGKPHSRGNGLTAKWDRPTNEGGTSEGQDSERVANPKRTALAWRHPGGSRFNQPESPQWEDKEEKPERTTSGY
jgi:hypothetical protein